MCIDGVTSPDGHRFPTAFYCNPNTPFRLAEQWNLRICLLLPSTMGARLPTNFLFAEHFTSWVISSAPPFQWGVPFTLIPKFSFTFKFLIKFALTEYLNYSAKPSSSLSNKPNFSRRKEPNFILTRHLNTVVWWHTPVIPALGRLKQEDHEIWATYWDF